MHVIFKTTMTKSEAEVWLDGSKRKYWVKAVNKLMKKGFWLRRKSNVKHYDQRCNEAFGINVMSAVV